MDNAGRIESGPVWVADCTVTFGEYVEGLQLTGRAGGPHGIAVTIYGWIVGSGVLIVHSWKKAEDALPRERR